MMNGLQAGGAGDDDAFILSRIMAVRAVKREMTSSGLALSVVRNHVIPSGSEGSGRWEAENAEPV